MAELEKILAQYTFLPWMRRGMGNRIKEVENFNADDGGGEGRPKITVKVRVKAKKGSASSNLPAIEREVELIGPGDITGLEATAIVKTEPQANALNVEPNYFPYIEFYEEDFPWRYTPAKADEDKPHKLRPWLALVVMESDEFKLEPYTNTPLLTFRALEKDGKPGAQNSAFHAPEESWAWAHVHVNADLTEGSEETDPAGTVLKNGLDRLNAILAQEPDRAVSRLICPRILNPQTAYTAFLIPAYEAGRLAGLGAPESVISGVKSQRASFGMAHTEEGEAAAYADRFPFYHRWEFQTGREGDFEYLVRKLIPREPHADIGKRPMDVQDPGYGVGYGKDTDLATVKTTLDLEGALRVPDFDDNRDTFPWGDSSEYRKRLTDYLNLSEDLLDATFPDNPFYTEEGVFSGDGGDIKDDPIVTADIYGRWHALVRRVRRDNDKWVAELNLDPRNRAVAGLGVEYVKKNQDALMDEAWSQLGEVAEANRRIRWGQLAQAASLSGFKKNVEGQNPESRAAITARVHRRLKIGDEPAYAKLKASALPTAVLKSGYRKLERPNGPLKRRLGTSTSVQTSQGLRQSLASKQTSVTVEKSYSARQVTISSSDLALSINEVSKLAQPQHASNFFMVTSGNEAFAQAGFPLQLGYLKSIGQYDSYFTQENRAVLPEVPALDLAAVNEDFISQLDPLVTLPKSILRGVRIRKSDGQQQQPDRIVPVMAYPKFAKPVYTYLRDMGEDFLIPNLSLLPENSITLLETNQRFIEAFMVGLNQEMGKELLWRQFPTDQRGSYFRKFWGNVDTVYDQALTAEENIEGTLDIPPIHEWGRSTKLGTHSARPGIDANGNLVLTIRGELLQKYPDVVITARKAKWQEEDEEYKKYRILDETVEPLIPVFGAKIEPDIYLLGFELTDKEAKGSRKPEAPDPGWFFTLQERPGEIRFGYDEESPDAPALKTWADLNEAVVRSSGSKDGHLTPDPASGPISTDGPSEAGKPASDTIAWGQSSSNMAQILYQTPIVIYIHADEMLP